MTQCQKAVGQASLTYLSELLRRIYGCLGTGSTSCMGQIVGGQPPALPALTVTAVGNRIDAKCNDPDVDQLDACSASVAGVTSCITCVGWRRAVDAVQSVYGPSS